MNLFLLVLLKPSSPFAGSTESCNFRQQQEDSRPISRLASKTHIIMP